MTEPMSPAELERRFNRLEKLILNGATFVRQDVLTVEMQGIRSAIDAVRQDVEEARAEIVNARKDQERNRVALRNQVLGAVLAGVISVLVAIFSAVIR